LVAAKLKGNLYAIKLNIHIFFKESWSYGVVFQ